MTSSRWRGIEISNIQRKFCRRRRNRVFRKRRYSRVWRNAHHAMYLLLWLFREFERLRRMARGARHTYSSRLFLSYERLDEKGKKFLTLRYWSSADKNEEIEEEKKYNWSKIIKTNIPTTILTTWYLLVQQRNRSMREVLVIEYAGGFLQAVDISLSSLDCVGAESEVSWWNIEE
jgi:hypothetical protein